MRGISSWGYKSEKPVNLVWCGALPYAIVLSDKPYCAVDLRLDHLTYTIKTRQTLTKSTKIDNHWQQSFAGKRDLTLFKSRAMLFSNGIKYRKSIDSLKKLTINKVFFCKTNGRIWTKFGTYHSLWWGLKLVQIKDQTLFPYLKKINKRLYEL